MNKAALGICIVVSAYFFFAPLYTGSIRSTSNSPINQSYEGIAFAQANRKTISVKDFGAKGDGRADDMRAIQAAINSAEDGSTIYFPPGTYVVSEFHVENRSNLAFVGEGQNSIIKQKAGTTRIAKFAGSNGISISRLLFDANGVASFGGVIFYSVTGVRIENNWFIDSAPKPIGSADRFAFVFGKGPKPSRDIKILKNIIEDLQLEVDHAQQVVIDGNTVTRAVQTAGIGIFSVGDNAIAEDYQITRNKIVDPLGSGFSAVIDPPKSRNCIFRRITIANNEVIYNKTASYGVRIGTLDNSQSAAGNVFEDIIVKDNIIRVASTAPVPSQMIFANASTKAGIVFKRLAVTGNEIHNDGPRSKVYALDLRRIQHSIVSSNTVKGVTNGIFLGADLLSNEVRSNVVEASDIAYVLEGSLGGNKAADNSIIGNPKQGWKVSALLESDAVQR